MTIAGSGWPAGLLLMIALGLHGCSPALESSAPDESEGIPGRAEGPIGTDTIALGDYFTRLAQFGFSGSVMVAADGAPAFVSGYGPADREKGRSFLPSTVVTVGSITKQVTAAGVLRLLELGQLELTDAISKHLPQVPAGKEGITIHHLLTHTSGLKRNGLEGGDFNLAATREAVLREALESQLQSEPGEVYSYSNLGYALLAMIVENTADMPFEEFVHCELLAPAGMYRTGYLIPMYQDGELAAGYRDGSRLDPVIRQPMLVDGPTWNLRGNGGLHSDAYDMFRWYRALRNSTVLSAESIALMTRAHVDQGGGARHYGYGWNVANPPTGVRDLSHSGGNGYFAADFHWLPDDDRAFFIASNDASQVHMGRLSEAVRAIITGDEVSLPPLLTPVAEPKLRRFEGHYFFPDGDTLTVELRDGGLSVVAKGDDAIQAVLGGSRRLHDDEVRALALRSAMVVEREFDGDFAPKFEAMGGAVALESLERYHGYDRDVWDSEFGSLQRVRLVAGAGEQEEVQIILRLEFDRGAAAQIHTWREGVLANISVIPDWSRFSVARTVFPLSETAFESFEMGSSLRLVLQFEARSDPESGYAIVFPRHPDVPNAVSARPAR